MTRHVWRAGTLTAALLAAPALAKGASTASPALQPAPGFGAPGLTVHSGLLHYTGSLGEETKVGTYLDILAEATLFPLLGVEAGYEGSANGFSESNVGTLWRHNASVLAKFGPTLGGHWKPYVGAGVGLSYLDTSGEADQQPFTNDWAPEVPLAAGVEYRFYGVTAGARATYRVLIGDDVGSGPYYEGDILSAGVSLGMRF
ncbi:outer membrane protein [Pyxidicoccus parkwayensis]|nr:outer membrane beta-barrel protein [Pyxidicoccus parkwaysis]